MNTEFLQHTALFRGFQTNEIEAAITHLGGHVKTFSKEMMILHEGDFTDEMGIILSGSVTIERIDYTGSRSILAHNSTGHMFAETYAFLKNEALMVDVVANEECEILFINLKRVQTPESKQFSWYPTLLLNLLNISDHKNLKLSRRSFHTLSKHVRGRVLSYLTAQSRKCGSNEFDIPFNRQQLADYLNLDRSALSNELGKMRDEGMIEFHKNHFQMIQ